MRADRIVLILVIISVVLGALHVALSIFSTSDVHWVHSKIRGTGIYSGRSWKNRTRGLLFECVDDEPNSCESLGKPLERVNVHPRVWEILRLRRSAYALAYATAALAFVAYILGGVLFVLFRTQPRKRQVTLLLIGIVGWIAAIGMYFSVIIFLEVRNQESYTFVPNTSTFRGGFSRELKTATLETMGYAFKVAIASAACGHVGSFLMMTASMWA
ncbi:hypothetical protein EG68_10718 [Paragonimus skrjabini miyazakii]|uniref:Uncharacterized protein n=1 Tax=Paragonimus skrjabini miyazakii TaxID=59628 RepID=A0A8S9YAX9_9TREM|nr:hypothetical protein EG68_10718 [Paragonimus skrjabini miyazakii]